MNKLDKAIKKIEEELLIKSNALKCFDIFCNVNPSQWALGEVTSSMKIVYLDSLHLTKQLTILKTIKEENDE